MARKKTREEHIAELAVHGRVELVGDYVNNNTKTLYRCLEHGEEHEATPSDCKSGRGLRCCLLASRRNQLHKRTREAHTAELAVYGRLKLVGDYVNRRTPTIYRCIEHGEHFSVLPGSVLRGEGLRCCQRARIQRLADQKRTAASTSYDASIEGRLRRIDTYVDARTPLLHECLLHGGVAYGEPRHLRRGRGLKCCQEAARGDSLDHALSGTGRFATAEATNLYISELLQHTGYLKPGISNNCERRAADAEYGALVSAWERYHRTLVYLPEQVLLKATRLMAQCPSALAGWGGASEVRRMDADALVALAQELMDEMDACANPWEFALAHGLLTPAQEKRARVLINAWVISEAELARVEVAA